MFWRGFLFWRGFAIFVPLKVLALAKSLREQRAPCWTVPVIVDLFFGSLDGVQERRLQALVIPEIGSFDVRQSGL